ncbi:MAG TPA: hypothetical protein VFT53_06110 [Candidatus Saccharimonadales bacterium]|nr:hypothetical protein [Candidatus Saccharimonadales bacterium]
MKRQNDSGFSVVEALLTLVAVAVVGVSGYLVYINHNKTQITPVATNKASTPEKNGANSSATVDPYAGWRTYSSSAGGYSIKYPPTWTLNASPAGAINGEVLITSSSAKNESFGVWLMLLDNSNSTSSTYSAFTQIPYVQGSVIQTLSNGIAIWEANQTLASNGHTYEDTCTPFESAANNSFGFRLNNGKYLDVAMSFCFAAKQSTTKEYSQQAQSNELQLASKMLSSLTQY